MPPRFTNKHYWSIFIVFLFIIQSIPFIPNTTNKVQALQTLTQTTETDFKSSRVDNISIEGTGVGAKLRLSLIEQNAWKNMNPSIKPSARVIVGMAEIYGTDKIVMFGGNKNDNPDGLNNETWVYDYSDNKWTQMFPPVSPTKRNQFGMSTIYNDDKVLLFGGWDGVLWKWYNDTWVYDLSDNNWTNMSPLHNPPRTDMFGQATIWNSDKVVIFGGVVPDSNNNAAYTNKTWVYDLSDNDWTEKTPLVSNPQTTCENSLAAISGTDKVLAFGGWYMGNATWIYDLSDDTWTKANTAVNPPWRYVASMASVNNDDKVILMYGTNTSTLQPDMWVYDLSDNKWTSKDLIQKPPPGCGIGLATLYNDDVTIFFGGWDGINWYSKKDETWAYNAASYAQGGYFVSIPYNVHGPADFKTLSWNFSVPDGTYLGLQLRTAKDEAGLATAYFVGPAGATDAFYTYTGHDPIWSGHNGDQWIQYFLTMTTTNDSITPYLFDISIDYNLLPYPPTSIYPANLQTINTSRPQFQWVFSDPDNGTQGVFLVQLDNSSDFSSVDITSGEITCSTGSWRPSDPIPDGTWYWRVNTKDSDGDWSGYNSTTFTVTIDTTPPRTECVLFGTVGLKDWYTSKVDASLRLYGMTGSLAWTRYRLDGGPWTNYTSSFMVPGEGHHTLEYYSKDVANNTEVIRTTEFKIDTIPPLLKVDEPLDGSLTNLTPAKVSGSTEAGATVIVNGVAIVVSTGLFNSTMSLNEGDNIINTTAFDEAGNHNTILRTVTLDTKAPELDVEALPSLTNRSAQALTGKAYDLHPFKVFVDGKEVVVLNSAFKNDVVLKEGPNEFVITAQDLAGNINRTVRRTVLDTIPPVIEILEPKWTKTKSNMVYIQGRTEPKAQVLFDGKELAVDAKGNFNHTVSLRLGQNVFNFKAIDPAGNENHKDLTLVKISEPTRTHLDSECTPLILILVLCAIAGASAYLWYLRRKGLI